MAIRDLEQVTRYRLMAKLLIKFKFQSYHWIILSPGEGDLKLYQCVGGKWNKCLSTHTEQR